MELVYQTCDYLEPLPFSWFSGHFEGRIHGLFRRRGMGGGPVYRRAVMGRGGIFVCIARLAAIGRETRVMKLISGMGGGGVNRVHGCSGGVLYVLVIMSVVFLRRKTGGRGLALEEQSRLRCQLANTYTPLSHFQCLTPQQDSTLEQRDRKKDTFTLVIKRRSISV